MSTRSRSVIGSCQTAPVMGTLCACVSFHFLQSLHQDIHGFVRCGCAAVRAKIIFHRATSMAARTTKYSSLPALVCTGQFPICPPCFFYLLSGRAVKGCKRDRQRFSVTVVFRGRVHPANIPIRLLIRHSSPPIQAVHATTAASAKKLSLVVLTPPIFQSGQQAQASGCTSFSSREIRSFTLHPFQHIYLLRREQRGAGVPGKAHLISCLSVGAHRPNLFALMIDCVALPMPY